MKLFNLTYLFALLATISFYSCKDEIHTNEESDLNATLTDVAHFSSQEQFDNSITAYMSNGIPPSELKGISSLAQKYVLKSSTLDDETDQEEDSLICSELLLDFLNSNYEIAVGDVFFRITEQGTFFTTVNNYEWLRDFAIDDEMITSSEPISYALGYYSENGMYKISNYENLYFFDTFRKKEPITDSLNLNIETLKSASFPEESEWNDIDDGRTLAGKAWDNIWGFSKSVRHYFDSKHRVDVKFYAQRFPFYSEMGIKTKTQYKGWTGIWRKQDCDEIINGWELLNLKEKWPSSFFGPDFNPNNNYLPSFSFENQNVKDLAYNQSRFLSKDWRTFNILGLELDFSQKDKVGALWNISKTLGKTTVKYLNGKFSNPNNQQEAIRVIPRSSVVSTTEISLAPYYNSRKSTDKYTMIIAQSSGGTIGVSFNSGSGFGYKGYTNLTAKYTFLENSVLYGAARRGATWRGVRITFK
jgi:hypothetical protein